MNKETVAVPIFYTIDKNRGRPDGQDQRRLAFLPQQRLGKFEELGLRCLQRFFGEGGLIGGPPILT